LSVHLQMTFLIHCFSVSCPLYWLYFFE
jgi:hypothetical protein